MKRLASTPVRNCMALLVLMGAAVMSCYGQVVISASSAEAPDNPNASLSQRDLPAKGTTSQSTTPGYVFPAGRERFKRYVNSTIGPFSLFRTSVSAGVEQWQDEPEEWKQGMSGYGRRFASSFGKNAIVQTVTYGLDSAMKLDTGFRRSARTGFGPRMKDALLDNITSRNRSGKRVFSVPRFAGVYSGHIIAYETWYPARNSYRDGLRSGSYALLTGFGINIIREFIIKR